VGGAQRAYSSVEITEIVGNYDPYSEFWYLLDDSSKRPSAAASPRFTAPAQAPVSPFFCSDFSFCGEATEGIDPQTTTTSA
jgi:hypothetical protein